MSDEEVEKFEVTDYDLDNEFNINRPRHRLSKNKQIYGIWAEDSDDEAGTSSSRRPSFKPTKKKQSYTAPVSFVAGGIQQAGKKKAEKTAVKKENEGEEDEEQTETQANSSSEEEQMPRAGFGKRSGLGGSSKRSGFGAGPSFEIDGDIAGLRKRGPDMASRKLIQKGVGSWEKHTKGIGAKLLLQMGYQPGKGLGRNLQGIAAPVEAAVRKGRGAIGAYGPETGQRIAGQKKEEKMDSDEEEAKEFTEKMSQWRKGENASKKKSKVKYVYKSVDQVIEEGKGKLGPSIKDYSNLSKVKVIDMTGPEQRVLSGYHAIAGQHRPTDDDVPKEELVHFNLPELMHNLDLLVTMCEQDILENDRRVRTNKDRKIVIEQEVEKLGEVIDKQGKQIENSESALQLIEKLCEKPLSLEKAAFCIKELKEKHNAEYEIYEMGTMASNLISPILREKLKSWKPLEDPSLFTSEFQRWQKILENEKSHTLSSAAAKDPFHTLVWGSWTPSIRTAASNWNCRQSTSMIALIETWKGIVPSWILNSVVEQLVMPRIEQEVQNWNPLTDIVPVHQWLHPWIPYAKERLITTIYPVIRRKLSSALTAWHPSDNSALLMLKPWKQAFPQGDMDAFLMANILPKLQTALQELVINPHQQQLDQWNWVIQWEELMPLYAMATLLEKFFFPKWLHVLTMWLTHNPNFDEVGNWFRGWKGMIPVLLRNQPAVKAKLNDALQLMNRAAVAVSQNQSLAFLTVPPPPPPPTQREAHEIMAEAVRTAGQIPHGFKELLQKKCEERGILFMPIPNRYHEAKQVYKCGKIQAYIDRNVLFVCKSNTNIWTPSNLQAALDAAE
ncbi:septin-interacting protein 1 [Neocloeon triangulifer]|uniref:septin-interacting protein 1 n=1 Tax=Neocloeon triangulifer TaxID=2078957 RepID=UPI00286EC990|nr:septin-interacting protein 1 [Neocloeon triangulifer]